MSESVQAPVTPTETAPAPTVALKDLSGTQYDNWLKTGDLPTTEPPTETEGSTDAAIAANTEPPTQPVVETEKPAKVAKPRDDINARLGQLSEQRNTERARAEKAERELAELRAGKTTTPDPVTAPVTPQPTEKPTLQQRIAKPLDYPQLANDVEFFTEYADAGIADLTRYMARYEHFALTKEQSEQATAHAREQTAVTNVDRTLKGLKEKYPTVDPSVLRNLQGPSAPIFAELVFSSDSSVELLNYFSNNPAEARTVAAMEPLAAAKALGKVESQLSTSAPSRVATPTKTVSDAPAPPTTLGARHTPGAKDEMHDALESGDTARYMELANKRDVAEMRAGRR